jgi:hypothetical protein
MQMLVLRNRLKTRTVILLGSLIPGDGRIAVEKATAELVSEVGQKLIERQFEFDGYAARKQALRQVVAVYQSQYSQDP